MDIAANTKVTVKFSKIKSSLNYYVALKAGTTYDADNSGNVKSRSTDLFTESLGKININPERLIAFMTEKGLTGQTSGNGRYCLLGNDQISEFFAYCLKDDPSSHTLMTSSEAISAINASKGSKATEMRNVLSADGVISDTTYRVTWTVLKYENDGWHIDGRIDPINYLSVTYFVDGTQYASPSYEKGTNVTAIDEPTQDDCTFSGWKLSDGTSFTGVTGISSDLSVYGTFQANTHNLTIHYVYANGTTAAPDYTGKLAKTAAYSILSPVISGYSADQTTVAGAMGTSDVVVTVTYTYQGGGYVPTTPTTPTTDIPEPTTPTTDIPAPTTDISDPDTPKADAAQQTTGDELYLWIALAGASGLSLAWIVVSDLKRRKGTGDK